MEQIGFNVRDATFSFLKKNFRFLPSKEIFRPWVQQVSGSPHGWPLSSFWAAKFSYTLVFIETTTCLNNILLTPKNHHCHFFVPWATDCKTASSKITIIVKEIHES